MDNDHLLPPQPSKAAEPAEAPSQPPSQIASYEQHFKQFRMIPKHEFEHRTMLLETSRFPQKPQIFETISKEIHLSNISDDKLLRVYQLQLLNVMEWHDMNLWEDVGELMFARMIGELTLSRARGGAERMMQAGAIPNLSGGRLQGIGDFFRRKEKEEYMASQAGSNESPLRRLIDGGSQYG